MGIAEQMLEMLFVSNDNRGQGIGKQLLQYAIENYSVNKLAVNEQNPLAKGFMNTWDLRFIRERNWMSREIRIRYCI